MPRLHGYAVGESSTFQEKLVRAMHAREALVIGAQQLVQGARVLNLPIVCTNRTEGVGDHRR